MAGPRPAFVGIVLGACALVAAARLAFPSTSRDVELTAVEVVHVGGGQAVLVLRETGGDRRLPIPLTRQEAAVLDAILRGRARPSLADTTLQAAGTHVARVHLGEGDTAALELQSGAQVVTAHVPLADGVGLALREHAPIVIDEATLQQSGISPDDLRAVRFRAPPLGPVPVQRM